MKHLFLNLISFLLLSVNTALSAEFKLDKNLSYYLPDNTYEKIITLTTNLSEGYNSKEHYFIKTKGDEIVSSALFIVSDYITRENATDYIGHDDVCKIKERVYYKNKIIGNSFNCWRLSVNYPFEIETDTFGVIFSNIFGNSRSNMPKNIQDYFKKNNLKYEIGLLSTHSYFSKLNQKRYIVAQYYFNPKFYQKIKNFDQNKLIARKNSSIVTSHEKKGLESLLPFFHELTSNHEHTIKAKKKHKLNILNTKVNVNKKENKNLIENLKELQKLHQSGIINDREFQKAKQKILK